MASSDDNESGAQHTQDEEANPFVSFRRFADEQVSFLLHNLIGLPSAVGHSSSATRRSDFDEDVRSPPPSDFDEDARPSRHSYLDEHGRFPRRSDVGDDVQLHIACQLGRFRESQEVKKIMSIYKRAYDEVNADDDEEEGRCPYRPFNPEMSQIDQRLSEEVAPPVSEAYSPSAAYLDSRGDGLCAANFWPIVYIVNSPYSPLHLERVSPFSEQGSKWRNAFEDLLAVKCGRPMPEDEPRWTNGSGAAWMDSMFERGIFGGGWKKSEDSYKNEDSENNAKEDEVTELDLYERFLGSQYPSTRKISSNDEPTSKSISETTRPSIISTLTTTERNTLPDGSVHTKVVLKKRFSDGREESTETVHTTYDSQQPSRKSIASSIASETEGALGSESAAKPTQPQKKGWFWS